MFGPSRKLIAAMFFSGLAGTVAAEPALFAGHMGMDPELREERAERMLERMASKLGLSAEQEVEIRDIFAEAKDISQADRERMRELRQQLRQADEGEVQVIADEIGAITSRLVVTHTTARFAVRDVLTEEQLQEMESLMEMRREHKSRWREHRRMHREMDKS